MTTKKQFKSEKRRQNGQVKRTEVYDSSKDHIEQGEDEEYGYVICSSAHKRAKKYLDKIHDELCAFRKVDNSEYKDIANYVLNDAKCYTQWLSPPCIQECSLDSVDIRDHIRSERNIKQHTFSIVKDNSLCDPRYIYNIWSFYSFIKSRLDHGVFISTEYLPIIFFIRFCHSGINQQKYVNGMRIYSWMRHLENEITHGYVILYLNGHHEYLHEFAKLQCKAQCNHENFFSSETMRSWTTFSSSHVYRNLGKTDRLAQEFFESEGSLPLIIALDFFDFIELIPVVGHIVGFLFSTASQSINDFYGIINSSSAYSTLQIINSFEDMFMYDLIGFTDYIWTDRFICRAFYGCESFSNFLRLGRYILHTTDAIDKRLEDLCKKVTQSCILHLFYDFEASDASESVKIMFTSYSGLNQFLAAEIKKPTYLDISSFVFIDKEDTNEHNLIKADNFTKMFVDDPLMQEVKLMKPLFSHKELVNSLDENVGCTIDIPCEKITIEYRMLVPFDMSTIDINNLGKKISIRNRNRIRDERNIDQMMKKENNVAIYHENKKKMKIKQKEDKINNKKIKKDEVISNSIKNENRKKERELLTNKKTQDLDKALANMESYESIMSIIERKTSIDWKYDPNLELNLILKLSHDMSTGDRNSIMQDIESRIGKYYDCTYWFNIMKT